MGNMCLQKMFDKGNNAHIKVGCDRAYYAVTDPVNQWMNHLTFPMDRGLSSAFFITIFSIGFEHDGIDVFTSNPPVARLTYKIPLCSTERLSQVSYVNNVPGGGIAEEFSPKLVLWCELKNVSTFLRQLKQKKAVWEI